MYVCIYSYWVVAIIVRTSTYIHAMCFTNLYAYSISLYLSHWKRHLSVHAKWTVNVGTLSLIWKANYRCYITSQRHVLFSSRAQTELKKCGLLYRRPHIDRFYELSRLFLAHFFHDRCLATAMKATISKNKIPQKN